MGSVTRTTERPVLPATGSQGWGPATTEHPSAPTPVIQGWGPATTEHPSAPTPVIQGWGPATTEHPAAPTPVIQGWGPATTEHPSVPTPVIQDWADWAPVVSEHPSAPTPVVQDWGPVTTAAHLAPEPPEAESTAVFRLPELGAQPWTGPRHAARRAAGQGRLHGWRERRAAARATARAARANEKDAMRAERAAQKAARQARKDAKAAAAAERAAVRADTKAAEAEARAEAQAVKAAKAAAAARAKAARAAEKAARKVATPGTSGPEAGADAGAGPAIPLDTVLDATDEPRSYILDSIDDRTPPPTTAARPARRRPGSWSARTWAHVTFGAVELLALVVYLSLGRHLWFYSDEWDYFTQRHPLDDPASLMRPHNGQWQTIPIVVYRSIWQFTGLRTYWPYLALVVALYLLVAALVYALILRAQVRPWIAVAVTVPLIFLGFAAENVVFGAQITYLGSVAFGLAQLLIVTGPRARERRPLGIVFGIAALMCSNLGVIMAVIVAAEVLLRRGWRAALAVCVPPAAVFVLWWTLAGEGAQRSTVGDTARFVWAGVRGTGREFSQHGDVGFALVAAVVAAGLVLAALDRRGMPAASGDGLLAGRVAWMRISVPLILGALAFLVLTGSQRATAFGAGTGASPRYLGVVITLLLPAAAVAVDSLWLRLRPAGLVALAILLVGVPGNVQKLAHGIPARAAHIQSVRALILALPYLPGTASAPVDQRPFPESAMAPLLTVGFVRLAEANGWLPPSGPPSDAARAEDEFRLAIYQTSTDAPARGCEPMPRGKIVTVRAGDRLRIAGGFVQVANLSPGPQQGQGVYYNPNRGDVLQIRDGEYRLRLTSQGSNGPALLCAR